MSRDWGWDTLLCPRRCFPHLTAGDVNAGWNPGSLLSLRPGEIGTQALHFPEAFENAFTEMIKLILSLYENESK